MSSNVVPLRPADPLSDVVDYMMAALPAEWQLLRPMLRETLAAHGELPRIHQAMHIPGAERLTDDERKSIQLWLRTSMIDYGYRCTEPLLRALINAKVEAVLAKQAHGQPGVV